MAQQRKLPPLKTLLELVEQGLTNREIAERYGTSVEAVRLALAKAGVHRTPQRASHADYLPWKIRADHVGDVIARRLRAYSKQQQGRNLSPTEERLLSEWRAFMDGQNSLGVPLSVHYLRMDPEGFWLEPRRAGDRDYVSPPS